LGRIAPTLVALLLVGGTSAAFAVAEKLKLERAPVTAPRFTRQFSPPCACATSTAELQLRFRRAETVDATIVDAAGETVRVLSEHQRIRRGDHTFVWDGRDDRGRVVADGRYRLRLHFERERRSILVPTAIRVDTRPPRLRNVAVSPELITPGGKGPDRVHITYFASEKSRAELLVDGRPAVRTAFRARGDVRLQWQGRVRDAAGNSVAAEPGEHELTLIVTDRAGNAARTAFSVTIGPPTETATAGRVAPPAQGSADA
jgi:hypothetical protein